MNRATQRSVKRAPRRMSGSRGGQSDRRILSRQGSDSNDSDVLKTTALSVVYADRDPNRADSDRVIRSRELRAERGPVWARVRLLVPVGKGGVQ